MARYEAGRNYYKRTSEAMRAHWRITSDHVVITHDCGAAEIVFFESAPLYPGQPETPADWKPRQ